MRSLINGSASSMEKFTFLPPHTRSEVLSLLHRFQLELVRTEQILIGNFQVGYLPNKQRTPSEFSDWILIGSGFPIGSARTESDHIPTSSNQFQADLIGKAHIT